MMNIELNEKMLQSGDIPGNPLRDSGCQESTIIITVNNPHINDKCQRLGGCGVGPPTSLPTLSARTLTPSPSSLTHFSWEEEEEEEEEEEKGAESLENRWKRIHLFQTMMMSLIPKIFLERLPKRVDWTRMSSKSPGIARENPHPTPHPRHPSSKNDRPQRHCCVGGRPGHRRCCAVPSIRVVIQLDSSCCDFCLVCFLVLSFPCGETCSI